jgi:VCBS repeat-containing protein
MRIAVGQRAAMINYRLLKNHITPALATLLIALLISACSADTNADTNTDNSPDTTVKIAAITGVITGNITEDIDPDGDNLLEVSGKLNITDGYGNICDQDLNNDQVVNAADLAIFKSLFFSTDPDADFNNDGNVNAADLAMIKTMFFCEAAFINSTVTGTYGSLTINATGNWNYAASNSQSLIQNLNTGATLTDSMIVSSIDGTRQNIVITIHGTDETGTSADIVLSWTAPAEREDNSALTLSEIAGYKVYYGSDPGQYTNNVSINDATATGYTFTDFPADTYYFAVTTIDTDDRESQYSTEISIAN